MKTFKCMLQSTSKDKSFLAILVCTHIASNLTVVYGVSKLYFGEQGCCSALALYTAYFIHRTHSIKLLTHCLTIISHRLSFRVLSSLDKE